MSLLCPDELSGMPSPDGADEMKRRKNLYKQIFCIAFSINLAVPTTGAPPIFEKLMAPLKRHGHAPKTCQDPAIEELAANVDWLEHNIDRWGSIVAKSPDVWGEARLTKYRREVEEQLAEKVGSFQENRISGASAVRDQALLAAAISMGQGGATPASADTLIGSATAHSTIINTAPSGTLSNFGFVEGDKKFFGDAIQLEQVAVLDQHKRYLDHLAELRRISEGDDAADSPGYAINLVRLPISVLPGTKSIEGHGAEITVTAKVNLDENILPRTFQDLVVADVVDSLSLPMTRFLNSNPAEVEKLMELFVNPNAGLDQFNDKIGNRFDITNDPELAKGVKDWLEQQSIDASQNAFAIVNAEGIYIRGPLQKDDIDQFKREWQGINKAIQFVSSLAKAGKQEAATQVAMAEGTHHLQMDNILAMAEASDENQTETVNDTPALAMLSEFMTQYSTPEGKEETVVLPDEPEQGLPESDLEMALPNDPLDPQWYDLNDRLERLVLFATSASEKASDTDSVVAAINQVNQVKKFEQALVSNLADVASANPAPNSLTRRSTLPIPPTQLVEVFGMESLAHIAYTCHTAFRSDLINREVVHLSDVRAFLREEVSSAHAWLNRPGLQHLWNTGGMPVESTSVHDQHLIEDSNTGLADFMSATAPPQTLSIVDSIRRRNATMIDQHRIAFYSSLGGRKVKPPYPSRESTMTLAWGVYATSHLLNQRMIEAMRDSGFDQSCGDYEHLVFYGPNPSAEARDVFASYVNLRWPLRIFTIDPVNNEQNIADTSSVLRQMQFAAAIAVADGTLNASGAMRFVRELQRDMATIRLNRTTVGFAHGADTFGWRFTPRFQTPPVESNAAVFFRDLFVGGPTDKQLRRSERLEPGMRECIAVMLVPSFVNEVQLDTRSNWFQLNKPSYSALSMREVTRQSRSITKMRRTAEQCVRRPDLYRDGETERLLVRVDQLDRELPLQTLHCQIPESNTLGGFEMFSGGTRELAPELLGWYGSPGYDPDSKEESQTFFVVGDNFSVHETKCIAGTAAIDPTLLSRQIMEIKLGKGMQVIDDERLGLTAKQGLHQDPVRLDSYKGYIDVHVATPYGVSNHLLIPVLKPKTKTAVPAVASKPGPKLSSSNAKIEVLVKQNETSKVYSIDAPMNVSSATLLTLDIPPAVGLGENGSAEATITLYPSHGDNPLPPIIWKDVISSGTTYSIGLPQLVNQIGKTGSMSKSLGGYAAWLLNSSKEPEKILGTELELSFSAAIAVHGKPPVPAATTAKLNVITKRR